MKLAKLLTLAFVASVSLHLMAQQANATASQSTSANAAGTSVNDSTHANIQAQADGPAATAETMRPVKGELQGKLDTKSAKVGDRVEVKTSEAVTCADGTVIPKGSRLVGHVTAVKAHEKESADSSMAIDFDHAELKGGQSIAIRSEIESLAPPVSVIVANSMANDDSFGGSSMGGARTGNGGPMSGGSVASLSGMSDTAIRTASDMDATVLSSGHVAGNTIASAGDRAEMVTRASGGMGIHATAISGMMLSGRTGGQVSGTLTSAKKNIHLDSGSQVVLGVAAAK